MVSGFLGWHALILLVVLVIVPLVLWIIALIQIAQSKASGAAVAVWIIITTLVPLIGAILWFAIGRRTAAGAPPIAS